MKICISNFLPEISKIIESKLNSTNARKRAFLQCIDPFSPLSQFIIMNFPFRIDSTIFEIYYCNKKSLANLQAGICLNCNYWIKRLESERKQNFQLPKFIYMRFDDFRINFKKSSNNGFLAECSRSTKNTEYKFQKRNNIIRESNF